MILDLIREYTRKTRLLPAIFRKFASFWEKMGLVGKDIYGSKDISIIRI